MINYTFNKKFSEKPSIDLLNGFEWRYDGNTVIGLILNDDVVNKTSKICMIRYIAKILQVSTREDKPMNRKENMKGHYIETDEGKHRYIMCPETRKKSNDEQYKKYGDKIKQLKYFKTIENMLIKKPQQRCIDLYNLNADKINEIRQTKLDKSNEEDYDKINEYFDNILKYV